LPSWITIRRLPSRPSGAPRGAILPRYSKARRLSQGRMIREYVTELSGLEY
jgi:hypothetical protein